jgi:hypothetical protein
MKITKQTVRSWVVKIIAILVVLVMVFAGFVVIFLR